MLRLLWISKEEIHRLEAEFVRLSEKLRRLYMREGRELVDSVHRSMRDHNGKKLEVVDVLWKIQFVRRYMFYEVAYPQNKQCKTFNSFGSGARGACWSEADLSPKYPLFHDWPPISRS